jgi:glycosyltransferase involved in cell wall biosynthesis
MKKVEVTIGIPAYNEEQNIKKLLCSLIKQKEYTWKLKNIILNCDGCTDNTIAYANEVKDKRIRIIKNLTRIGKPLRTNEILELSNSEILVIFDADILITDYNLIEKLVGAFINKNILLASGPSYPIEPKTYLSKVIFTGIKIWDNLRLTTPNAEMYLCEGSLRAFRKILYKQIRFPNKSADDVYPFLFLDNPNKFKFVKDATIYYKLPITISDFISQQIRYSKAIEIHNNNFSRKLTKKYFVIGNKHKRDAVIHSFYQDPFWTFMYVALELVVKIFIHFSKKEVDAKWKILKSTRK